MCYANEPKIEATTTIQVYIVLRSYGANCSRTWRPENAPCFDVVLDNTLLRPLLRVPPRPFGAVRLTA